jgi:MFS family permease
MNESPVMPVVEVKQTQAKTWHCGTLTYTKAGIVTLFTFLLFGSFSFNLMMTVVPSILPLKLKSLGASDVLIGMLLTSVFPMFGLVISPYLSFKSDYLRTRWGRRKPFFFFTLPFVTVSILLLAFSEDIARLLQSSGLLASLTPATAAIAVMSVCIVAFQFSDVVIASVYNYIFNDTVPVALTGRFFGLMQMVGASIGFLYNYFIFKYAESHMKEIFVCTALVYFVGIGLLCVFVKEGEYPPVNEKEKVNTRGFSGFKTFFRESFSHEFYWTKFVYSMSPALGAALWPFGIFYYKEMGLSLDYIGKASAVTALAGMVAAYFASVYIDRWHPLRILAYSGVFAATLSVGNWVWLFVTLPPAAFFWLNMLGGGLIGVFHGALCGVAAVPFDMRLQPKSRYGQFCSAQSIVTNACKMIAGGAAGYFFYFIKEYFFPGSDYAYRFNFVWSAVASIVMGFVICSLYRQWQALGGDRSFNPPAPWSEKGYEEMERPQFVGTQVRWLNHALGLTNVVMFSTLAFMIWVTYWLWHIDWSTAFHVYLFALIPVSVLLYLWWVRIERGIKADVALCAEGKPTKDGIPHHGIFFVKAIVLLLGMPVKIGLMIVAMQEGLHVGVIVFGIGAQVADLGVILAVLILRRMERGNDPMLNYDGRKAVA